MSMGNVDVAAGDGIMTVTLRRPEKKNAITAEMYERLSAAFESAESNPDVKTVLIDADGDTFCAGNDLADFATAAQGTDELPAARFIRVLTKSAKPVIAAVQGNAVGIGTTMLLHCDLVYIAHHARLAAPFARLGIVPEAASSLLLPARIGHARAFAMFALGDTLDAAAAVACGLATAALPMDEVRDTARNAAKKLSQGPHGAFRQTKLLMREIEPLPIRMERELSIIEERVRSANAQEAVAAFGERRQPVFVDDHH